MDKITAFFEDMKQKRVAFIGTGVSHTELIAKFREKGIGVTVLDKRPAEKFQETYDALTAKGVQFLLGDDYLDHLTDFDVVFRTPGMYFNNEAIARAREAGVVITSEMESFFDLQRDSSDIFEGLKVSRNHPDFCAEWMNQYPVLFLSLKDVEGRSFDLACDTGSQLFF